MKANNVLRLVLLAGTMACVCISGCAPMITKYNTSFTESTMPTLRTGMTPLEVEHLFGLPDISYELTMGEKTGEPWTGIVFKYYTIKDPGFNYTVRYKTNTLVFDATHQPAKLHHWSLEHVYPDK